MESNKWPAMPPAVAKAVVAVMRNATKLGKDEKNPFANYKYAGIESFLEMLKPICSDAGLIILQDEESYEFRDAADKGGKLITWLVMTYSFGLAHESGETWEHRIRRTAMVQASMGSQAFGAAQSYALKFFLRQQGLIPTGENDDADSHEQRDLPKAKGKTKAESRPDYAELQESMRQCETRLELNAWAVTNRAAIEEIPDSWQSDLRREFKRTLEGLVE